MKVRVDYSVEENVVKAFKKYSKDKAINMSAKIESLIVKFLKEES